MGCKILQGVTWPWPRPFQGRFFTLHSLLFFRTTVYLKLDSENFAYVDHRAVTFPPSRRSSAAHFPLPIFPLKLPLLNFTAAVSSGYKLCVAFFFLPSEFFGCLIFRLPLFPLPCFQLFLLPLPFLPWIKASTSIERETHAVRPKFVCKQLTVFH